MKKKIIVAIIAILGFLILAKALFDYKTARYEAVFLDHTEIDELFKQVRGEAPLKNVTKDYHITTDFSPKKLRKEWYGEKVTVHITAYKLQEIEDDNGNPTACEAFKAALSTDDAGLQEYLDSLGANFHITGSYESKPKYAAKIDFSDGLAMDIYVEGEFGCEQLSGINLFNGHELYRDEETEFN